MLLYNSILYWLKSIVHAFNHNIIQKADILTHWLFSNCFMCHIVRLQEILFHFCLIICFLYPQHHWKWMCVYLRNEFDFWYGHGIMNTLGLLQSKWSPKGFGLTLQETWSIHDSMNIPKIEFITYKYVSKQATLLDGLDLSPLKWRVCGCGFNWFVHEGSNDISNVKVHLKTGSGNVNISYGISWKMSRINSYFIDRYIIKNRSSWILPAQLLFGPFSVKFWTEW